MSFVFCLALLAASVGFYVALMAVKSQDPHWSRLLLQRGFIHFFMAVCVRVRGGGGRGSQMAAVFYSVNIDFALLND